MKRISVYAMGLFGSLFSACAVVGCLGLQVTDPDEPWGAGGKGAAMCTPASIVECKTDQLGSCALGKTTCGADGTPLEPCVPTNMPTFDDCRTLVDEDCDGVAVSQCTGKISWTYTRGSEIPGSNTDETINGLVVLPTGGYAATGAVEGIVASDGYVEGGAMFVAKLDEMGEVRWFRSFSSSASLSVGHAVATDSAGNIVVVGDFVGEMSIDGQILKSPGSNRNIFIGKIKQDGQVVWFKSIVAVSKDSVYEVVVDSSDNIYITGRVQFGPVNFGGADFNVDGVDPFLAKFDSEGKHIWSQVWSNPGTQQSSAMALTPTGDLIIVGYTDSSFTFGGPMHSLPVGFHGFIARFGGADGSFVWSRAIGGSGDQFPQAVTIAANGNPLAVGYFSKNIDFGDGNLVPSKGTSDGFLAEFDIGSGTHVRNQQYGTGTTYPRAITTDGAGHVYVAGAFTDLLSFGNQSVVASATDFDEFTAKIEGVSWAPLWIRSAGNLIDQAGTAVAVDSRGQAIIGGFFDGELARGNDAQPVPSTGGRDLFVRRLDP